MRVHAGALLERPPGPKYLAKLRFAELGFRSPLPKPTTLGRFRATLPDDFVVSLVVPTECRRSEAGPLRWDEGLNERFEWLPEAAEALSARFVVLPTKSDLTPGQRDRDRLAKMLERLRATSARHVVWAPRGLWEREEIESISTRLGVIAAFDVLEEPAPEGPVAYSRLRTIGARSAISAGMVMDVVERAAEIDAEDLYVAIDSQSSFKEASMLATAAGALG